MVRDTGAMALFNRLQIPDIDFDLRAGAGVNLSAAGLKPGSVDHCPGRAIGREIIGAAAEIGHSAGRTVKFHLVSFYPRYMATAPVEQSISSLPAETDVALTTAPVPISNEALPRDT